MRTVFIAVCVSLCLAQVYAQAKPLTPSTVDGTITTANNLLDAVTAAEARYAALQARQAAVMADMDSYWLIVNAALVFLMQAGFALYESGTVRPVAQQSVFFKNILLAAVVGITWWLIGWALAFGDNVNSGTRNGFIGNGDFILVSDGDSMSGPAYGRWFFEWSYALIPTTLVTLAVAERLKTSGIILISIIISGFIYPVIAHWEWSNAGWLSPTVQDIGRMGSQGMFDFAGSGVIFLTGGAAGLATSLAIGARANRFEHPEHFRPRNKLFITFGALLVWFTYFAYTTGRSIRLSGPAATAGASVASKVTINSVLGGVGGFFGGFPLYYLRATSDRLDIAVIPESILSGLAAIAAGVSLVEPWAALTIGFIGGLFYFLFRLILTDRVDDTLNGFSTFAVPAFWGLIAVGLFTTRNNTLRTYGDFGGKSTLRYGLFYGGGGEMLWVQIVGAIAILAWSFLATFIIVKVVACLPVLTLDKEDEKFGIDSAHFTEFQTPESFADVVTDAWSSKVAPTKTVYSSGSA